MSSVLWRVVKAFAVAALSGSIMMNARGSTIATPIAATSAMLLSTSVAGAPAVTYAVPTMSSVVLPKSMHLQGTAKSSVDMQSAPSTSVDRFSMLGCTDTPSDWNSSYGSTCADRVGTLENMQSFASSSSLHAPLFGTSLFTEPSLHHSSSRLMLDSSFQTSSLFQALSVSSMSPPSLRSSPFGRPPLTATTLSPPLLPSSGASIFKNVSSSSTPPQSSTLPSLAYGSDMVAERGSLAACTDPRTQVETTNAKLFIAGLPRDMTSSQLTRLLVDLSGHKLLARIMYDENDLSRGTAVVITSSYAVEDISKLDDRNISGCRIKVDTWNSKGKGKSRNRKAKSKTVAPAIAPLAPSSVAPPAKTSPVSLLSDVAPADVELKVKYVQHADGLLPFFTDEQIHALHPTELRDHAKMLYDMLGFQVVQSSVPLFDAEISKWIMNVQRTHLRHLADDNGSDLNGAGVNGGNMAAPVTTTALAITTTLGDGSGSASVHGSTLAAPMAAPATVATPVTTTSLGSSLRGAVAQGIAAPAPETTEVTKLREEVVQLKKQVSTLQASYDKLLAEVHSFEGHNFANAYSPLETSCAICNTHLSKGDVVGFCKFCRYTTCGQNRGCRSTNNTEHIGETFTDTLARPSSKHMGETFTDSSDSDSVEEAVRQSRHRVVAPSAEVGASGGEVMAIGVVTSFNDKKGWGFIAPGEFVKTEGTKDVFVHQSDIGDGVALVPGEHVIYDETTEMYRGKPTARATNVQHQVADWQEPDEGQHNAELEYSAAEWHQPADSHENADAEWCDEDPHMLSMLEAAVVEAQAWDSEQEDDDDGEHGHNGGDGADDEAWAVETLEQACREAEEWINSQHGVNDDGHEDDENDEGDDGHEQDEHDCHDGLLESTEFDDGNAGTDDFHDPAYDSHDSEWHDHNSQEEQYQTDDSWN